MDTSKRSHEAPMTFNAVSCNGVLMPKVQERITVLRLTSTRNRKGKVVFLRGFNRKTLFYLGKSQTACNRRLTRYAKTRVWCTAAWSTMGIYRGVWVCNRTYDIMNGWRTWEPVCTPPFLRSLPWLCNNKVTVVLAFEYILQVWKSQGKMKTNLLSSH